MELELKKEKLDLLHTTCKTCIIREETADAIVPDTQPDILRIIDVCAQPLLKAKDTQEGSVTVKGTVQATVLYIAEDGELYKVDAAVPYSISAQSSEIGAEDLVVAAVKAVGVDGSMANPRKIVLKLNIKADICCYTERSAEICCGITDERVYQQSNTEKVSVLRECGEKVFVIADEMQIPETMPGADEILSCECNLKCGDYSFSGSKLIIRGTLETDLCWIPVDGTRPRRKKFTSDFSQMMDTEFGGENAKADIEIMMTGCFAEFNTYSQNDSNREITLEVHAVAQYKIYAEQEMTFVKDMYSNVGTVRKTEEQFTFSEPATAERRICHIKSDIRCASPGNELFSARVRFGEPMYTDGAYKVNCYVNIAYFDTEGELVSAKGSVPATYECDKAYGNISADAENITVVFGADTITAAADMVIESDGKSDRNIANITELSLEPWEEKDDLPSVIVYRVKNGDDMWSLAKKYRSCCRDIAAVNGLEEDVLPECGRIILIPKA